MHTNNILVREVWLDRQGTIRHGRFEIRPKGVLVKYSCKKLNCHQSHFIMRRELQDLSSYSMIRGFSPSSQVHGCTVMMLVSCVVHWKKSSNHRHTFCSMLDIGHDQEVQGRRRRRGPSWNEGKYNDSSNFNVGYEILFWVCGSSIVPVYTCTEVCDCLWKMNFSCNNSSSWGERINRAWR